MSKVPNLLIPPPPFLLSRRQLNKKHRFKQKILYLIGGSLSGILLSGIVLFGITLFSPYKVKPLEYTSPSQVLNKANEKKRLKKAQNLLTRYQTLSSHYLPNNQFGGMNMFGFKAIPERSWTITQAAPLVDEMIPALPLQTLTYQAKIGPREYTFHLFDFNGTKYWHPYGNVVTYRFGKSDRQDIYKYAKNNFPDRILPEGFGIELDHSIPNTFADAMTIPRTEGVAVLVPKFANAVRTNDRELGEDFSNFDWHLNVAEQITNVKDGLERLIYDRLNDSLVRNLSLYCSDTKYVKKLKKENPNLNLDIYKAIYPELAAGYNKAYTHDMEYYQVAFCNKFNIPCNDQSSVFAFYNELLLQGVKRDFELAKL